MILAGHSGWLAAEDSCRQHLKRRTGFAVSLALLVATSTPVIAQPQTFSIPQDPVAAYFQVVVVPAMSGTALNDQELSKFFHADISIHSQVQVAEDQFIAHWHNVASQVAGSKFWSAVLTGARLSLTYDIGEPVYNETKDQARFKVTVTLTSSQLFRTQQENRILFVHVIKEEGIWKIVISPELVAEMQKLPTKQVAKRYAVARELTQSGIRLVISTVSIENDFTVLEVSVENATEQPLDLFNALSAATLRDDLGSVYQLRMLRTTLPTDVPAKQTVKGTLVFAAIPPVSKKLVLTIPDAKVGAEVVTLSLEFALSL